MYRIGTCTAVIAVLFGVLFASEAQAQWALVDDFESYALGDINGKSDGSGTWVSDSATQQVVVEPGTSNQVLDSQSSDTTNTYNDDPALIVAEGTVGTLFFRMKKGPDAIGHVVYGLSDVAAPSAWGDYEVGVGDRTNGGDALDVRDGGSYVTLDQMPADEWLNMWVVSDNTADMVQVYAQSDTTYPTQTLLDDDSGNTSFSFRNGTTDPLATFLLRTGADHVSPFYVDDIYLDPSGVNLVNPIPEPSSLALLAFGFFGVAVRSIRRRTR